MQDIYSALRGFITQEIMNAPLYILYVMNSIECNFFVFFILTTENTDKAQRVTEFSLNFLRISSVFPCGTLCPLWLKKFLNMPVKGEDW